MQNKRLLVAMGIIIIAVVFFFEYAYAASFSFSRLSPVSGSTVNSSTIGIRAYVSAGNNLDKNSATVTISDEDGSNSITYSAAFSYSSSYKNGYISYSASNVKDGVRRVTVTIKDVYGNTGSHSWTFTVMALPVISELYPADQSSHNSVSTISAKVTDNGEINTSKIIMNVNTKPVSPTYNSETTYLSYNPETLLPGTNTVYLYVEDMLGNSTSLSWSFTVTATPPEFKNLTPVPESTLDIINPTIKADIEDPEKIKQGTPKMYVDDVLVNASFAYRQYYNEYWQLVTDYTRGTISYKPTVLANSKHKVRVEAEDDAGNSGSATWYFTVAAPPKILEINPAPNTTLSVTRPIVSIDVTANEPLLAENVTLTVYAEDVPFTMTPLDEYTVRVSYEPNQDWQRDSVVPLKFRAVLGSGLEVNRQWSYGINPSGEMPGTGRDISTCILCHDVKQIKQNLCGGCHASSIDSWQTKCFDCHFTGTPPSTHHRYGNYFHETISDHELTPAQFAGCNTCHSRILTREHNRNSYTCGTCHEHLSTTIQNAITLGQRDCLACHTGEAASLVHPDHKVTLGSACVGCHGDNMMTEKVRHNNNCAGCHNSANLTVQAAIEWQKNSCFDCHDQPHQVYMVQRRNDIPLYSGVQWSLPQQATIWSGEGWLPALLENEMAELLLSSRANLTIEAVYNFYQTEMAAAGWQQVSSGYLPEESKFTLEYTKGRRSCFIWFYNTDVINSTTVNSGGARIMIGYH